MAECNRILSAPWSPVGPRTRARAPRRQTGSLPAGKQWELSAVLKTTALRSAGKKINYTSSNIGKTTSGRLKAIESDLPSPDLTVRPISVSIFPSYIQSRHPIWGSPMSGDQEGADAGCWREAQYGLTGGETHKQRVLTKQNQNSFILQNAPAWIKQNKTKHLSIENLKLQWFKKATRFDFQPNMERNWQKKSVSLHYKKH